MFNRLEAYHYQHGTLDVDREQNPILWAWANQQRKNYQKGKVPEERIALLEAIDFVFDLHEALWLLQFENCSAITRNTDMPWLPPKTRTIRPLDIGLLNNVDTIMKRNYRPSASRPWNPWAFVGMFMVTHGNTTMTNW